MRNDPVAAETLSVASSHRDGTLEAYESAVVRAVQHMRTRLDAPLDLGELARVAAVSKFHLVRVFDEITGTTPRHFLSCLRMQRAKEILLNSDMPVTDVCFEVGYNSLGSFSKTFHELVGVSPQDFRRLPKRLSASQFAAAVWRYLSGRVEFLGPVVEGVVEGPGRAGGFVFVGAFTNGVPLGAPFSGTVLVRGGTFRLRRPETPEFHLLAALVPWSATLSEMVATIPIQLVASLRVTAGAFIGAEGPRLRLRTPRPTDPPIVMALPALAPLRNWE